MSIRSASTAFLAAGLFLGILACGPGDPRVEILEARAGWMVEPTSWVVGEDGTVIVGVRISGPARTPLTQLTFRILLHDAAGETLREEWQTIELSGVPQGSMVERQYRLDPGGAEVDAVTVDPVRVPTADQEPHIAELAHLSGG